MAVTFRQLVSADADSADAALLGASEARFASFWAPRPDALGVLRYEWANNYINTEGRVIFLALNNGSPAAYMACIPRGGVISVELIRAARSGIGASIQRDTFGRVLRQFMNYWKARGYDKGRFTVTPAMLTYLQGIFSDATFSIICNVLAQRDSAVFAGQREVEVSFR